MRSQVIDKARLIGGAKAVVDVEHRDPARARVEHSQQSREALEARLISRAA